jgi:hypothetical protein
LPGDNRSRIVCELFPLAERLHHLHETTMTPLRTLIAIMCMFFAIWVTDFVTHQVLLVSDYVASMSLWRTETEMLPRMPWLLAGQLISAITLTLLYIRGFAHRRSLNEAVLFGLLTGLLTQSVTPAFYAIQPLPGELCIKWFVLGTAQGVILGLVLYAVCRPRVEAPIST